MANVQQNYPDTKIKLDGHTDNTLSNSYNQKLSKRRAGSVVNYLCTMGVTVERITETGFGESLPVADNNTFEGGRLNRRVDIGNFTEENLKVAAEKGNM